MTIKPGEPLRITVEWNFRDDRIAKDWSLTAYAPDGPVHITHFRDWTTDELPVLGAPPSEGGSGGTGEGEGETGTGEGEGETGTGEGEGETGTGEGEGEGETGTGEGEGEGETGTGEGETEDPDPNSGEGETEDPDPNNGEGETEDPDPNEGEGETDPEIVEAARIEFTDWAESFNIHWDCGTRLDE